MGDDSRILELLEEIMESKRAPEEVCVNDPELLTPVRERLRRLAKVQAQVDAMFPSTNPTPSYQRDRLLQREPQMPEIPGYEMESILGYGGMGVVYRARHINLKRSVAIKMLLAGAYAGQPERERFIREAQTIANLCHPNIVAVFDVGEVDGRPYFTMEYVENGTLAQKLGGIPQPSHEATAMCITLAQAIQVAHDAGIVHRDLKPSNILLASSGIPKISDFGLATWFGSELELTQTGARIGTPSYMAPEQAVGKRGIGPAVDVYSLGALLYELLTGRPPFRADSSAETQRQVISEDPVPPSKLNAKVPRDLETICLKCLQKNPSARYASAQELRDDLQRYLNGEPISARRTGVTVRTFKWIRRHPAHAAIGTVFFAVLGAILSIVLWTASQYAAIERAVSDDLAEVIRLEEIADWRAARNTLERAKTRLGAAAGRDRLEQRATSIERELDLVDRLGEMRFERAASRDLEFDQGQWWRTYRNAFVEAGLLNEGDSPQDFSARIANSSARTALIGAMDDWTICATNRADLDWLLSATRAADPDQWRDKARDLAVWTDPEALAALAREAPVESQPVPLLLIVAGRLLETGSDFAEPFLRKIQAAHPTDFWTSFALAESLDKRNDSDAIGFYRAAIALRPEAAAAHVNLGLALASKDRFDEAIQSMSTAVTLDPRSWVAQCNLAGFLLKQRRFDEAQTHARIATQIKPLEQLGHRILGRSLAQAGKFCESVEHFHSALELSPEDSALQTFLARAQSECASISGGPSSQPE